MPNHQTAIVWFKNDLRIHDHAALSWAVERCPQVVPVYCFDPRHFGRGMFGLPKASYLRVKFLLESVQDLRNSLQKRGSDLLTFTGLPEEILPKLASRLSAGTVFAHREITHEEQQVEKALLQRLSASGIGLALSWGNFLYDPVEAPFPADRTPEVFTRFRQALESRGRVQSPLAAPELPPLPPDLAGEEMPDATTLGFKPVPAGSCLGDAFRGGESGALLRLQQYFWETHSLSHYKETRNQLFGENASSKFSPWLAHGCISPRQILAEVRRYEEQVTKNQSTYWLIFELIWRDFFRYIAMKHGRRLFLAGGIKNQPGSWREDEESFERWKKGETGMPFIDANMRELNRCGFMSNRGRQNVASFLVKDLNIDWRRGAAYFESRLVDYDVCSNWGNWNYVAGVGNDPRENRYFNILTQAQRYDASGEYVRRWLPELSQLPPERIHMPFSLSPEAQQRYGVILGKDYPHPLVVPESWKQRG